MSWFRWLLFAVLAGSLCWVGCTSTGASATDLDGRSVNALAGQNRKATVLIFISNDCPIANRYAPEITRLQERYQPRGVALYLVHADPQESPARIREHAREYKLTSLPILRDADHSLVRMAGAEVIPSAAVFDANRKLVYHGRIDDRFVELGQERPEATQHDLANALDALLNGREVPVKATKAVGCYIPGLQ
jgi:hypothetical protein